MGPSGQEEPAEDPLRLEAIEWLSKVRGHPDLVTEQAFRAWYEADTRHAETFESVLTNWKLSGVSALTPAAETQNRLATYGARRRLRHHLLLAASLVLGVAVVAGIARVRMPSDVSSIAGQERLTSGAKTLRTVTLADGSRVTLDRGSEMSINFTASERRLILESGRARFEVAHDREHPFIVDAGAREIVAHGTLFDVDLRAGHSEVSLIRGSIEVRLPTQRENGQQHGAAAPGQYLVPGQRLPIGKGDKQAQPGAVSSEEGDWTTGMIAFDDRPLSEVIAYVNQGGSARIVLAPPALGALRFTGTLRTGKAQDIAQMLAASFGLDIAGGEQGAILLTRRN